MQFYISVHHEKEWSVNQVEFYGLKCSPQSIPESMQSPGFVSIPPHLQFEFIQV